MTAQLGASATRRRCTRRGRAARRRRRGVPRDARRGARRAAQRGRCSPAAAPRPTTSRSRASSGRAAARTRAAAGSWPARSSTTPSWTPCTGWPSTRAPWSSGCRSTPPAGCTRRRSRPPSRPTPTRSRWSRSCGPTTRSAPSSRSRSSPRSRARTASRSTPTRCRRSASSRVDFAASGLDAMTVTGHKLGGPLGVGALLLGRTVDLVPVLHGGGQERDVRSGTLDTAGDRRPRRGGRGRRQAPGRAGRAARRPARRPGAPGRSTSCPTPSSAVTRGLTPEPPAARQRALLVPRLRGRRPAAAARRPRHRVLDRLGLLGRRRRSRATCCWRWACPRRWPAARCGSPSATPPPRPTSTRVVEAIGPVVERARRAGQNGVA